MKPLITIDDFLKIEMRVGLVKEAVDIEGSDKLLKLTVDFGPEIGTRTVFSGIKQWYTPEQLTGKKYMFIVNLAPKVIKIGNEEYESQGMIIAADSGKEAILYNFDTDLPEGSIIR